MSAPGVTILMAVRNGAGELPAQLASFRAQQGCDWRLIASDDGSADDSRAILEDFALTAPAEVVAGPGRGFVANFLSLLARPGLAGPVALADQDDIWFPNKLARALAALTGVPAGRPALYCSRRVNWWPASDAGTGDTGTGRQRLSRAYPGPHGFANALVENVAPGNTIVLNAAALDLARETVAAAEGVPFHDWWLYLLVSGAGGVVIHDPQPGLLYRQHGGNVLGQGEGFRAAMAVRRGVMRGAYGRRIGQNLAALMRIEARLTPDNRRRLADFAAARQAGLPGRLALMRRAGVYRQGGWRAAASFWGAVCLGRV